MHAVPAGFQSLSTAAYASSGLPGPALGGKIPFLFCNWGTGAVMLRTTSLRGCWDKPSAALALFSSLSVLSAVAASVPPSRRPWAWDMAPVREDVTLACTGLRPKEAEQDPKAAASLHQ